jgi:hypothetical protein
VAGYPEVLGGTGTRRARRHVTTEKTDKKLRAATDVEARFSSVQLLLVLVLTGAGSLPVLVLLMLVLLMLVLLKRPRCEGM